MSDAAPPTWIKAAPGLAAAHKFMLSVLWGYGPYRKPELWIDVDGDMQPRKPARCWESAAELAKLTGQPVATVRNQLRKLAADGWILRDSGSMRTLAWRAPGVFKYGEGVATGDNPLATDGPVQERPPSGHERHTPRHECTGGVATGDTQTFQGTSNSTSSDLAAAHATPSESTTPGGNTDGKRHAATRRADDLGDPDGSQRRPKDGAGPGLGDGYPEHVQAKHDRVTQSSHVDPVRKSNGSPGGGHNPSEPTFAERVAATSEAARMAQDSSSEAKAAWVPCMQVAAAEFGEDGVVDVLTAWAAAPHGKRPRMGSLWHTYGPDNGKWFVGQVLGTGSAPAKREALSDVQGDGETAALFDMLDRRRAANDGGGS